MHTTPTNPSPHPHHPLPTTTTTPQGNSSFWVAHIHQQRNQLTLTEPHMIQRANASIVPYYGASVGVPNARGEWPLEYGEKMRPSV